MIRLFRVSVPASTFGLFVFEALLILSAFVFSAYLLLEVDPTDYLLNTSGMLSVALVWFSLIAGIHFQSLYSQVRVRSRLLLLQQLLMVAGIAFLLQAMISALAPDLQIPLRVMLLGSLLSISGILAGRLLFSVYVLPRAAGERLLLIGNSPLLDDIDRHLDQNPHLGILVAGHLAGSLADATGILESGRESGTARLENSIETLRPNRIVVGFAGGLSPQLAHELLELRFSGHAIEDASGTYERICNREGLNGLNAERLLYSKEFDPGDRALFFQVIGNCAIAALLLILLSPLLLLIGALLALSSHAGVIERQTREGCNGPFTLYRFRVGRGTRVGRILSRTGLYALPQFVNVLRGQMSMVGPRPDRPEFVRQLARHIPFYPHRLNVRPGIAGWSQIHLRHTPAPWDSMTELEYDLYYIKYFSPMLDVFVLTQAIKNLLIWGGQP